MPLLNLDRSVVVVIDIQGKLVSQVEEAQRMVDGALRLLRIADLFGAPVVLTEQYPRGLGPTDDRVLGVFDGLETPHRRLEKTAFGCCGDAGFVAALEELSGAGIEDLQVVVAGMETHVCVLQTVLELLRAGAEVHLCWDCVSGRGRQHHERALLRMAAAGAEITNLESVGFEWARDKDHPRFREFSALLKEGQIGG